MFVINYIISTYIIKKKLNTYLIIISRWTLLSKYVSSIISVFYVYSIHGKDVNLYPK